MSDKSLYRREYWEGGLPDGSGYKNVGYQNFPSHLVIVDKLLERKPVSVLDIGCARGYIVKMLQQNGIPASGVDISDYCYATRVTDTVHQCDVSKDTLPFKDKEFDLGFSISVLEHIETADIPHVIQEIARVCKRAVMCPSFRDVGEADKTHRTLQPKDWWERMFAVHAPGLPVEIIDKEIFEKTTLETLKYKQPTKANETLVLCGRYVDEDLATMQGKGGSSVVLNIGSYIVQFRSTQKDCVVNMDVFDNMDDFVVQWGTNYMRYEAPKKIPFPDNTISAINCSHMLEHLSREDGLAFLKECHRVLKAGGVMRIAVPNAEMLVSQYLHGVSDSPLDDMPGVSEGLDKHKIYNVGAEKAEDYADMLYHLLLDNHKTIYDIKALSGILHRAGFPVVKQKGFNQTESVALFRATYDMYPEISLYVEAIKNIESHPLLVGVKPAPTSPAPVGDELAGMGETVGTLSQHPTPAPTPVVVNTATAKPPDYYNELMAKAKDTSTPPQTIMMDYLNGKVKEGKMTL